MIVSTAGRCARIVDGHVVGGWLARSGFVPTGRFDGDVPIVARPQGGVDVAVVDRSSTFDAQP